MGKLLPDPQIGTLGGTLLWVFVASIAVVILFTTGMGPVVIWAITWGVVLLIAYFAISRLLFRLKRGK